MTLWGHKDILAVIRYKMILSPGGDNESTTQTDSKAQIWWLNLCSLFVGWCEQQARGCVCTTSYQPPPGTPGCPIPTSPGAMWGHHWIINGFAKHTGVRLGMLCTKPTCTGHSRYWWVWRGLLHSKWTLLFRYASEWKVTGGVPAEEIHVYKDFNKDCMPQYCFKGVLHYKKTQDFLESYKFLGSIL